MQWLGASGGGGGNGKKAKNAHRPIAFIGKGVTFDTGGISIKPAGGMEDMKFDMAGGAAVIGLMAALAGRRAKVDAVGLVGMVENMPSGNAQRPGDVVKTLSGKTVEVINTDAEGRLVLADVMSYCQERFQPAAMVDLATLTGAIIIALGHEHAGLFSNDDELAARIMAAGKSTGEACWRMPLGEAYDKQIKSDIADMKNVGGRPGGSITAAQFLQRFVGGKDARREERRRRRQGRRRGAARRRACPGRISTSPAPPGPPRTCRRCRRAPPASACGCSTAWWRRTTKGLQWRRSASTT